MKKTLEGFNCTKQKYENSCWIAVANAVLGYMHHKNRSLWHKSISLPETNIQGSAIDAIYEQYREIVKASYFGVENWRLPAFDYIKEHIDNKDSFVSLLTTTAYTSREPVINCSDGHWIALIGYDDDDINNPMVIYYDPGTGGTASFIYNDRVTINGIDMHFANTTLIEIDPGPETRRDYLISQ